MTPLLRPGGADPVDQICRRLVRPAELCQALGLLEGYQPVRQAGGGLLIRCPAHGDRTPSCSVTLGPDGTLRVRCFGCDLAGGVFALVAAARGLDRRRDFPRVLEEAAALAGLALPSSPAGSRPAVRALPRPVPAPVGPLAAPATADDTFRQVAGALLTLAPLSGSIAAGLAARQLLDEARRDGWGELPTDTQLSGPTAARAWAEGFGTLDLGEERLRAALRARFSARELAWILRPAGLVHPAHRLLIPWRAPDGSIWGLQRRYAPVWGDEPPPRKVPKYLWPPESLHAPAERFAYGLDAPERETAEEVWLCEGAVDVLALRALNRQGRLRPDGQPRSLVVLGLPGVGAWPALRRRVLALVAGRTLVVALDADAAGRALAGPVAEQAWRAGARLVRDKLPPQGTKDWAEALARESR